MASRIDGRRGQEKGGMQTDAAPSSVPVLIDRRCRTRQQRQLLTHPCGPQAERHTPGTLVTGEAAVAALLITPASTGAAGVGDAPAKPMAIVAIAAVTIIRIVTSCRWSHSTRALCLGAGEDAKATLAGNGKVRLGMVYDDMYPLPKRNLSWFYRGCLLPPTRANRGTFRATRTGDECCGRRKASEGAPDFGRAPGAGADTIASRERFASKSEICLAPGDLRTAARDARIFCLPLIEVAWVRTLMGVRAWRSGTGINSFFHQRELARGARQLEGPNVVGLNVDTLYSSAFIDLVNGLATVILPPTGGRYLSSAYRHVHEYFRRAQH